MVFERLFQLGEKSFRYCLNYYAYVCASFDYVCLHNSFVSSEKARTPSPQLRQTGWIDPFPNQRHSGEHSVFLLDKHQLPIKHAQWSNVGTLIVSTGEDLQTIVRCILVVKILSIFHLDEIFLIIFSFVSSCGD